MTSDLAMAIRLSGSVLRKARKYVDSPGDAPAGVSVQEGERGGHYYESEGADAAPKPLANRRPMDDGDAWAAGLSKAEQQALKTWTLGRWKEMRAAEMDAGSHALLDAFHSAIDRAPLYKGGVMRGMRNLSKKDIKALMTAEEITLNATSSASKNGLIAAGFAKGKGGVLMRITQHSGSDITPGVGSNNAESEVLLHQGTRYRVTGTGEYVRGGVAIPVVELEEVAA